MSDYSSLSRAASSPSALPLVPTAAQQVLPWSDIGGEPAGHMQDRPLPNQRDEPQAAGELAPTVWQIPEYPPTRRT